MSFFILILSNFQIPIKKSIILILLLSVLIVNAQDKDRISGKITGRVIDSLSGEPIEYATISLYLQKGDKLVNGISADMKGIFKLTNISEGNYKILVDFIGYKRYERKNITISTKNLNIFLGDIKLSEKQNTLNEIIVSSDKIIIENKIDKLVYNADKDITSQSGVATDVLKKVPQVSVDVDGNVDLQGNTDIRFLINGKPSVLFGNNITDVLQSIPASQIQSIEVITSPGAKYEAEGTGGIINIILKKSNAHGVNGNMSLSGGTRLENGSFNLNIRNGNFGVHGFLSGNAQMTSTTVNKMDRLSEDTTTSTHLLQDGTSRFSRNGYQSGVGFDWDFTPRDNISGSLGYNYFGNDNSGSAIRQTFLLDASKIIISDINDGINTSSRFHSTTFNWDLTYKKKFRKENQELEIWVNSSDGNNYSHYNENQEHLSPDILFYSSYGNNPGTENETNFTINYSQPFCEKFSIETGAKTEMYHIDTKSDVYLLNPVTGNDDPDPSQSSTVDYKRKVFAYYFSSTFKFLKIFDIKAGLRDEYTETKADFSNSGTVNINPYNTLVPSLVIAHTFTKRQVLKISYSHRIQRPNYGDLNPFVNASDPKNMTTGNPNLHPEIGDKLELGYSETFDKEANINTTLFYRGNKNDIQSYTTYYPVYKVGDSIYSNVAVTTRENIGREDNFGLSLFGSVPFTEAITMRTNISCFERYINTGIGAGSKIHGFNYRANINGSYQVTGTLILELSGNFNSPRIGAQGKMPAFTTYNFAFRKQLFDKKGSIAITATNFLDKYVYQKTELSGYNFSISNTRELPYRSFGINFTYKFGHLEFRKEKEEEDINLTNPPGFENLK